MRLSLCLLCFMLAVSPTAFAACEKSAAGRFMPSGGEVFDSRTGLTWRRCSVGLAWSADAVCSGEKELLAWQAAAAAASGAGAGWRVPSLPELASLLDASCGMPAIDTKVFPDVSAAEQEESAIGRRQRSVWQT